MLLPEIFDIRSKRHGPSSSGPVGVWVWVIPPHVVEAESLSDLKVFRANSSHSEAELATESAEVFSRLTSFGCRLHKILSGGGGWGLKQGLLSLDPETSYTQPEQDDIEMFIKAFQERNSSDPSEGLVTPGSYVLFCIEPYLTEKNMQSRRITPTISLSVAPNKDEGVALRNGTEEVEICDDHFGAASTAGLFLRTVPETNGVSTEEHSGKAPQQFTTKINNTVKNRMTSPSRQGGSIILSDLNITVNNVSRAPDLGDADPVEEEDDNRGNMIHIPAMAQSTRDDSRSMDTAWVHDRFEDSHCKLVFRLVRRRVANQNSSVRTTSEPEKKGLAREARIRVENLHYELTEDDLDGLFNKIGPVVKLELLYDRAGRSDGQPIRLSLVTAAPRRNPFDSAHMPGRPLAERITRPRSLSPRRSDNDRGVDRYVPGRGSRSPLPRRRGGGGGGRRPGAKREAGSDTGPPRGRDGRPRKTAEELDAEMADYFNPSAGTADAPAEAAGTSNGQAGDDVDMIE
ncbi:hypothetical protein DL766_002591 [Monosporascus sp. MC13-8B]|uniref:RRM domain-containing protein n=1 Tax=Monosporascus cannonballus TaxID=155416 RepID=A0ABY0HFW0_9PEZI|nr:hypothetical protein DL763_010420 [Monosporascus cannonballus]RYO91668.1 hypothetical protein DL762_002106 [Monosporascus cannonballus]RYP35248.1 hypothetical protein DL766_002591 [Monosporascus sp. MC13-8B]